MTTAAPGRAVKLELLAVVIEVPFSEAWHRACLWHWARRPSVREWWRWFTSCRRHPRQYWDESQHMVVCRGCGQLRIPVYMAARTAREYVGSLDYSPSLSTVAP